MKSDRILSQISFLLPLIHAIMCFTFLFGYSSGFGSGIGSLFSIEDIFSISLNDMAIIYIVAIGAPAGYLFSNRSNPQQVIKKRDFINIEKFQIRLFYIVCVLFFGLLFLCIWQYLFDIKVYYLLFSIIVTMFIGSCLLNLPFIKHFPTSSWIVLYVILTVILNSLLVGLNRGQEERRNEFNYYKNNIRCGNYIILRSASDKFIALDKSGSRYVIDDSCSAVFSLPNRPLFK